MVACCSLKKVMVACRSFVKILYVLCLQSLSVCLLDFLRQTKASLTEQTKGDTEMQNFSCVTYNWDDYIICHWDYFPDITVNASSKWRRTDNSAWNDCPTKGVNSCTWKLYDDVDPERQLNVCITLPQTMIACYVVNIQSVVKPSPIRDIRYQVKNSTSVSLEWTHDNPWYNKTFKVKVKEKNKDNYFEIFVDFYYIRFDHYKCSTRGNYAVVCPSDKTVILTITGLSRYSLYIFAVSAKPHKNGFWSDGVEQDVKTLKDAPSFPPLIHDGSYSVESTLSQGRIITVYWQPLVKTEWNSDFIQYQVHFVVANTTVYNTTTSNFYAVFTDNRNCPIIHVHIWSYNGYGVSINCSTLTIYNKDLIKTVVLVEEKPESFELSRFQYSRLNDYEFYLFWCPKKLSFICKAPLQMIQVNTYNTTIHIPELDESNQYLIGMSYTSKNESSGFVWSNCLIRKNKLSLELDVSIYPLIAVQELEVHWRFTTCNLPVLRRLVENYEVQLCRNLSCKSWTTILINGSLTSFQMQWKEICIQVTPVFIHERGRTSQLRCFLDSPPTSSEFNLPAFFIISGICAALFCIGLIICLYRKLQSCGDPGEIETIQVVKFRSSKPSANTTIANGNLQRSIMSISNNGPCVSESIQSSKEGQSESSSIPLLPSYIRMDGDLEQFDKG